MDPSDPEVRKQVLADFDDARGRDALIAELEAGTSHTAPRHVYENDRRLLRAVEVLRLTGTPPWAGEQSARRKAPRPGFRQFIVLPKMGVLRPRIEQRTESMLRDGWIEETEQLLSLGLLHAPTARQALGYKDIADYIQTDRFASLEALQDCLVGRTVRFARRQQTWFRHQHPGAEILTVDAHTNAPSLAAEITARLPALFSRHL